MSEIKTKFNTLTESEQKLVNRTVSEIKQSGTQIFWMETGSHANEPGNGWLVVKFAMESLKL